MAGGASDAGLLLHLFSYSATSSLMVTAPTCLTYQLSCLHSALTATQKVTWTPTPSALTPSTDFPANDTLVAKVEAITDACAADCSETTMPPFIPSSSSHSCKNGTDLPFFHAPEYQTKDSIDESLPVGAIAADTQEVQYTVVPASSQWHGDKLTDSLGFSYCLKNRNSKQTMWKCSVHNQQLYYNVTVCQEGEIFTRGPQAHLHPGQPGIANSLCSRKKIYTLAPSDIFTSAAEITEKVLAENVDNEPMPLLPANAQLTQNANHLHQHYQPKDAKDLDFDLAKDFIPVNNCHNILFAMDKLIDILSCAKYWFIDATFKIV